ncbi:hypothetical protein BR93DRAFT_122629 [Coniochaeta sp. PMI_546]|nr:hypothetical protein BR93DRAFT_122629 [Coniochaeta sp. PMI_546]
MMARQPLPEVFQKSYLESATYPKSLVHRTVQTYPGALQKISDRLNKAADRLFEPDNGVLDVPFRDLRLATGAELDKENIGSSLELEQWFKIDISVDRTKATSPVVVSTLARDPKCRMIYIWADHSRARLKISRKMLMLILTFHQVMPAYLDFIYVFGEQFEQPDLRFSGFREQTNIAVSFKRLAIPSLSRSGRQFQICYNLKNVELKKSDPDNLIHDEWSIRQAAIHHQFDIVEGTTLWIITKGSLDLQQRFKELTGKEARPEDKNFDTAEDSFRASLSAHLLWCYWSTDDWRSYLRWLETAVQEESDLAVLGPRGAGHAHKYYRPQDVQSLQIWEEKANTAIMVLVSNIDVMQSLAEFYKRLQANKDFDLATPCSDDIDAFAAQINDIIHDFRIQIGRATDLVKVTNNRKELVMQHLQSQSAERMEILNRNMEKEAIVVRIITIVTLIYLPATFVSTFFSTDVVKYQGQEGGGNFSRVAMERWIEVTIPLTLMTLIFAWWSKSWAETKRIEEEQPEQLRKRPQRNSKKVTSLPPQVSIALQSNPHQAAKWQFPSRQNTSRTVLPLHTLGP